MARSGLSKTDRATELAREQFAADVRSGLTRKGQKELPSKYLYDELGTALFEAITHLPEYGLTRADTRLLTAHSAEIAAAFEGPLSITEFGSGTGQKSRLILEAAQSLRAFYPIDVSPDALSACAAALSEITDVVPVEATYLDGLARVAGERRDDEKLLALFLGSTIGNFDRSCATEFASEVRDRLHPGDGFLVGADLVKPEAQLLAAYDDPAGVTAAFNRNLLGRINRELRGEFDLRAFEHEARCNAAERRIEMHLRSLVDQRISIAALGVTIDFRAGETIWTESSHKFEIAELEEMARAAGFAVRAAWIDDEWPFVEALWIAA